LDKRRNR